MAQNSPDFHSSGLAAPQSVRPTRMIDPASGLTLIDVAGLLGTDREAILLHNGDRYRLRVTANNRLILTK